jgi:ParB-like chromosome segregation protein Spo0J
MRNFPTIKKKNVSELIPYVNNARTHNEAQIKQIASSIAEYGFTNPILIDDKGGIIAGHGRLEAARLLNYDAVPTITLEGLTEAQKKAYIIIDNNLALNASWDFSLLGTEIERLKELEFDLDLIGFSEHELSIFLDPEGLDSNFDMEGVKELEEEDFSNFDHKCPRCGFEFDDKK